MHQGKSLIPSFFKLYLCLVLYNVLMYNVYYRHLEYMNPSKCGSNDKCINYSLKAFV